MFVKNPTDMPVTLKRGLILDDLAVLCVGLVLSYRIQSDGALVPLPNDEASCHDPPSAAVRLLWRGTSVTAFGHAAGPSRRPFATAVHLRVGDDTRSLVIAGPRRWQRVAGQLSPSEPEPFEAIPLTWAHAFGGGYHLEPGLDPLSRLPHPGGHVPHPLNPRGRGYYRDAHRAEGQPLPSIEDPRRLLRNVEDSPTPVCFAPCPDLTSLRAQAIAGGLARQQQDARVRLRESINTALWLQHHAPPELIFDEVARGTRVELIGLGERLAFPVPACPIGVTLRARRNTTAAARPRLRSLHVDADARRVQLCWGFGHRYPLERPPHWIEIHTEGTAT